MGKRLQIRNIPHTFDSNQLQELCTPYGSVKSATVVVDQYSGKSRGFGYVEMSSPGEALKVIEQMHGKSHEGKELAITEAPAAKRGAKARV